MPIYMDVHSIPGVKAKDVAEAHRKDLLHQDEHGCKCMTYWIDEERENIFCLIEAPAKEAVEQMHDKAHGLIPNRIIEVDTTLVESFLGRIYDPEEAPITDDGLKVFEDSSFRTLLVTTITDPVVLRSKLGEQSANDLLFEHNTIIRTYAHRHGGREAEHRGSGFIISFDAAAKALACATEIQRLMTRFAKELDFKIAINSGEPIEHSHDFFGDTIRLAQNFCFIAPSNQLVVASGVKELVAKDFFQNSKGDVMTMGPQDERLLDLLFDQLEKNWQESEFDITEYCEAVAMSRSQLYRKTVSLTGHSPNQLLKEYRLEKAKDLMRKQRYSIAQITFDSGFTSPSYFTKCFKKKFGLLPMAYIDLLH